MSELADRLKNCMPAELYEQIMVEQFRSDPSNKEKLQGLDCVIQIKVTGDGGGTWLLVIKEGDLTVRQEEHPDPSMSMEMSFDNWKAVTTGEIHPQQAFMEGKMVVSGDMSIAMQLGQLFQMES